MSCDIEAAKTWPDAKDPDDKLDYAVSFEKECARKWEPFTDFIGAQRVRVFLAGQSSGFEFEPTTAGRTAGSQPRWPTTIGATVNDGSVTWTCRAISSVSLIRTISGTPTWTDASGGLTITSPSVSGTTAIALIDDGVDVSDYTVLVKATFSDGNTKTAVCILKVRRAQRVCEG